MGVLISPEEYDRLRRFEAYSQVVRVSQALRDSGVEASDLYRASRDELENKKTDKEIRLLFGVRSEEDIFWIDRLEALKQLSPLFDYQVTLSQPKADGGWSGLRGRVTEHLLHHLVSHKFYLCGSAAMVKDVRDVLLKNGIAGEQIHFEVF